ncbi:hypothetical protein E0L36_13855 [Streptomyces sp. AJS327]|uniref:hypothetical protein n=1 Tax=Streptomyces sp. AJS327 TaxID=2545265 RepID=UPI0015DD8B5B|nr:hypothetical protein [Streptomyces sp. AJS327]MBA0051940.1 hypothetical protein [Streptomyces sp. AJS327]
MTWRYRCQRCELTSPRTTRAAAEELAQRHRAAAHDGLIPDDGEELWPETGLSLPARRMLLGMALGGTALLIARWLG